MKQGGTEAQRQWETREGHMSWVLSVRQHRGGELDRGHPGVHAAQRGAPAHRAYPAMHAPMGSATQGPRWCAFGYVSSTSGTGCARLHGRAPGAASRLAQEQAAVEQRAALTRCYMTRGGDATALGCERTSGGTTV
jgi:hypothetical protein